MEEKIKEKIDDFNWMEVFEYTKGIMGLERTTKHALEHLMAKIVKFYSESDQVKAVDDPFAPEYVGLAPAMIKLLYEFFHYRKYMLRKKVGRIWAIWTNWTDHFSKRGYPYCRDMDDKQQGVKKKLGSF